MLRLSVVGKKKEDTKGGEKASRAKRDRALARAHGDNAQASSSLRDVIARQWARWWRGGFATREKHTTSRICADEGGTTNASSSSLGGGNNVNDGAIENNAENNDMVCDLYRDDKHRQSWTNANATWYTAQTSAVCAPGSHGDATRGGADIATDLMSTMLPIEVLVLIYGRVHRDELEAAAIARWSGYWDRNLGGHTNDDDERGGPPGIYRLLTLSRAHHDAVSSALNDWRSWPDSCYGPGAAIWLPGIACAGPRHERRTTSTYVLDANYSEEQPAPCGSATTSDDIGDGKNESHNGHHHDSKDDDGGDLMDIDVCGDGNHHLGAIPRAQRHTQADCRWSVQNTSQPRASWIHPVLADQRLHGLWLGAAMYMPPCWLGTPARHLVATASRLVDEASPSDEPLRRRWLTTLSDILAAPAWPAPCLVLCVQVPHACDFAHQWAHRLSVLTLTRTYLCAPGSAAGSRFTVGGIVDAIADFYAGSPLSRQEMERIRAHARSVWRTYERHYGRPWDPYDFAPGGGARLLPDNDGETGYDRDGGDGHDGAVGRFVIDVAATERPGRILYGRDPYRGGWGRRNDAYERRFESWFVDRWLGEGDLPPSERVLARQFADPDRYGCPRLCDLAPPPTHDDPPPRLVVERFGCGRRRGVRQLTVRFARVPDT